MTALLWLFLGLSACGSATESAAPTTEAPAAKGQRDDVDIATFAKMVSEGVTVIDVRTDAEYASGHVPGALHVPLSDLTPDHKVLAVMPKDEPVYFVCASGGRSARASDMAAKAGWHAVNVLGGTSAWVAAGNPVE